MNALLMRFYGNFLQNIFQRLCTINTRLVEAVYSIIALPLLWVESFLMNNDILLETPNTTWPIFMEDEVSIKL